MSRTLFIHRLFTALIACVWLLSGLCAKVLHLVPRHEQIVAGVLGREHASTFTLLIGIAEISLSVWILSGISPRLCALLRTPTKLTTLRRSKLTTCFAGEKKSFTHEVSVV